MIRVIEITSTLLRNKETGHAHLRRVDKMSTCSRCGSPFITLILLRLLSLVLLHLKVDACYTPGITDRQRIKSDAHVGTQSNSADLENRLYASLTASSLIQMKAGRPPFRREASCITSRQSVNSLVVTNLLFGLNIAGTHKSRDIMVAELAVVAYWLSKLSNATVGLMSGVDVG